MGQDVFGQDKAGGGGGQGQNQGGGGGGNEPKPNQAGGVAGKISSFFMLHFYLFCFSSGTADPNYQTLCGMGQDVFGQDKAGGAGGGGGGNEPKPNQAGGVAGNIFFYHSFTYSFSHFFPGTADPNYQTLCGMGQDVFGQDKKN